MKMLRMVILRRYAMLFIVCAFLVCALSTARAAERSFIIRAEKAAIPVGKQSEIECVFPGEKDIPPPEMPLSAGLVVKYSKSSTRDVAIGDGRILPAIVHIYKVIPARTGDFSIGPVSFKYNGDTYHSDALIISAVKPDRSISAEPVSYSISERTLAGHIYTVLDVPQRDFFPNELIPVCVKLFSDWLDLTNITISDPSSSELIIKHFEKSKSSIVTIGAMRYAVLEYTATVSAAMPGTFILDPITVAFDISRPQKDAQGKMPELLNANEQFYDKVFSGRDIVPFELKTGPAQVRVVPRPKVRPPEIGQRSSGEPPLSIPGEDRSIVGLKVALGVSAGGDPYFYRRAAYMAALVFPFIIVIIAAGIKRRLDRIARDPYYAAWLRVRTIARRKMAAIHAAMDRGDEGVFYETAVMFLREYLGVRFGIPPEGFTASALDTSARGRINDAAVLEKISDIFSDCYSAQFSVKGSPRTMRAVYDDLYFVIGHLDKAVYL